MPWVTETKSGMVIHTWEPEAKPDYQEVPGENGALWLYAQEFPAELAEAEAPGAGAR